MEVLWRCTLQPGCCSGAKPTPAGMRQAVDEQTEVVACGGRNRARCNGRGLVTPQDLPVTERT